MTNPFAYREASNPLSRFAAGPKALFLLCSTAAAMAWAPQELALLLAGGLVLHAVSRITFRESRTPLLFILGLSAAAALFRGIAPGDGRIFASETLIPSILYALRLAAIYLYARVFYASTRVSRLGDSLTLVFRKAAPAAGKSGRSILSDPGLLVTLTLLFLPRVFDDLIRVREAAALRCYGLGRKNVGRELAMLGTMVLVAVKGGLRTAGALEARGYSSLRSIETLKWNWADWLVAAAGPLLLVLGAAVGAWSEGPGF
jgi:energy-coupling factor transporter transmembrane protein EcfT